MAKKFYYFNVSFSQPGLEMQSVIVKHLTPRMTHLRILEAQTSLGTNVNSTTISVSFLGKMTEKQWSEEI
ncbi:hypothetical protein KKI90_11275 [Xenorhabdus bovienii]|uniref:Uncharacterized protein n=1 Tax=Xenorhabdus bovienii TaxID=40576 RepID=A0AAJ1JBK6_XENBV|nr:hypothetical protein [Xenorhabdus bovienii]MDE1480249.1 hypothetical protein [Xenorhabdus bovienii]MDE1480725.1 hypothetical protein [Xenorhabdus bovienii]MDE1486963.1 hypothetical protein [Xenorhabdus bovienii]MDE1493007.1 hypothetical protein [Xenorhabdus bovienii]MDE1495649.1 hypothetical protein [Xenorhabdus bovienii]